MRIGDWDLDINQKINDKQPEYIGGVNGETDTQFTIKREANKFAENGHDWVVRVGRASRWVPDPRSSDGGTIWIFDSGWRTTDPMKAMAECMLHQHDKQLRIYYV